MSDHDHYGEYAEEQHRHYDLEREDETAQRDIRRLQEDVRELRSLLDDALDRIRGLEHLRPTCTRCLDATATQQTASGPACAECAGDLPEPEAATTVYGPHCSHDECSWITCDGTGLVEFHCRKPGCPYCGAPLITEPEHWAGDPARVAAMTPDEQARVGAHLDRYPLIRRGPGDSDERLHQPDEPESDESYDDYDPGPECDDEGGMSEYRYVLPEDS